MAKQLSPRQQKSAQIKQRIFDVFCRLSRENNGNVTIQDICREAEVSVGSFYHYFESKEAITSLLYDSVHQKVSEGAITGTPEERIHQAADRLMAESTALGVPFLRSAAVYESGHMPSFAMPQYTGRTFYSPTSDAIIEALNDGAAQGIFRLERPDWFYSDMIIFLFRALLSFWTVNDGNYDIQTRLHDYIRLILESIRA